MSLSPRAIATLGVGFGAVSVAYLGLWPVGDVEPPQPPIFSGGGRTGYAALGLGFRDDLELLELAPIIVEVLNGRR